MEISTKNKPLNPSPPRERGQSREILYPKKCLDIIIIYLIIAQT